MRTIKFHKTECGVDFLLNVLVSGQIKAHYDDAGVYNNVTATHLLKQRLLFEIKNYLIHSELTVAQIADELHFPEPNHLMRFFKMQTGLTTTEFLADHAGYQNGIIS